MIFVCSRHDHVYRNPKEMTKKKLPETNKQLDTNVARYNVARYKVTIHKSIAFLYNNEQLEFKMKTK